MAPDTPLHRALAAWRRAERRLRDAPADDPERERLVAECERLRAEYQALFDTVEAVVRTAGRTPDETPLER